MILKTELFCVVFSLMRLQNNCTFKNLNTVPVLSYIILWERDVAQR